MPYHDVIVIDLTPILTQNLPAYSLIINHMSLKTLIYPWADKKTVQPISLTHYNDVIMRAMASQITSLRTVYPIVYWGADQRKHQSSASLAFVRRIHRGHGEFPAQRASHAESVSIWWRHHGTRYCGLLATVSASAIHFSMPRNMIILYFRLPYFYVLVLYFLHSTSLLSYYIDVVLAISTWLLVLG